jgi:crotonobetainyl-CoA:carnitine CoA-transferase CaiB-like acyl-CoA transferase
MCKALKKPEWIEDERFSDTTQRFKNAELRKKMTAAEIARWERDEILSRLDAEGVPSAPLLTRLDLLDDEQIAINGTIEIYEWEGHGKIRQARPAATFETNQHTVHGPAPLLGEHNVEVLLEVGYAEADIDALVAAAAIRSA